MTVAVAALCKGDKEGALAADRMLVADEGVRDQTCKISTFCDGRLLVACAGTYEQTAFVLERLRSREASLANATVAAFTDAISEARKALQADLAESRRKELNSRLLLFGSCPDLHASTDPQVAHQVQLAAIGMLHLSLSADFLVMGRDSNGVVRLYTLTGLAGVPPLMPEKATIGSGWAFAANSLNRWAFTSDLEETVYKVYEASRHAEGVIDVGGGTDMAVFRDGQNAAFLPPEAVKELGKVYWENLRHARSLREAEREGARKAIAALGESRPPSQT
jgi:hypothetical protein